MCGRYVSRTDAAMERVWELRRPPPLFESFNVAPTQDVPIIRELEENGRDAMLMRWGLIPTWAKGLSQKYSTINATVERMKTAPAYRNAWKRSQRCLVPAHGFFEWQVIPDHKQKQPYCIQLSDPDYLVADGQFAFGGLWECSRKDDGEAVESFTIITMPANELMAEIHNSKQRMPLVMPIHAYHDWLIGSQEKAERWIAPCPSESMAAYPVSTYVNRPGNNDPRCVDRVTV